MPYPSNVDAGSIVIPKGGSIQAIDNNGVLFTAFFVEGNNHVAFKPPSSGSFDFLDENGSSVCFSDHTAGFGVAPNKKFNGSDISFNTSPVLFVDSTNGNTNLQAHPTGQSVNVIDSSGNVAWSTKQSSSAASLSNGSTITTTGVGGARVTASGAVTGIILQAGTTPTQDVTVYNESAFTVTFAASGTSHVADGTSAVISANKAMSFTWDTGTNLWYHT